VLEGRATTKTTIKPTPLAPDEPDWADVLGNPQAATDAAACWRSTVPELERLGLATVLDLALLTELCVTWARLRETERIIGRDGVIVEGYRGSSVKHPAVTVAGQYRTALAKLMHACGLTPAARQQLDVTEDRADYDPLAEIAEANARAR
jgi:P27 family predicted phage terminase small subunit